MLKESNRIITVCLLDTHLEQGRGSSTSYELRTSISMTFDPYTPNTPNLLRKQKKLYVRAGDTLGHTVDSK
jgi:hypothetical protein